MIALVGTSATTINDREGVLASLPDGYLLGRLLDGKYYEISKNEPGEDNPIVGRCELKGFQTLRIHTYPNGQPSLLFLIALTRKNISLQFYVADDVS